MNWELLVISLPATVVLIALMFWLLNEIDKNFDE
jgi:hypothetical protein